VIGYSVSYVGWINFLASSSTESFISCRKASIEDHNLKSFCPYIVLIHGGTDPGSYQFNTKAYMDLNIKYIPASYQPKIILEA
jgi:muramidase (phage lysozyme)